MISGSIVSVMKKNIILSLLMLVMILIACDDRESKKTLFRKIDREIHNIGFENTITENDTLNILTLEYIYNGGGVAIADFNDDGLSDVFFTGNMVANQLYLNKGDLKFGNWSTEQMEVQRSNSGCEWRWIERHLRLCNH
jgi:hypothetical protein